MDKKQQHAEWYLKNADRERAKELARRHARPALYNARSLASKLKNYDHYLEQVKEQSKRRRMRLKEGVVAALGGRCCKCGYSENIHALQVDHINGDGHEDRKNGWNQWKVYKDIIDHGSQNRYQLLCANCHCIKTMENREHKSSRKRKTFSLPEDKKRAIVSQRDSASVA